MEQSHSTCRIISFLYCKFLRPCRRKTDLLRILSFHLRIYHIIPQWDEKNSEVLFKIISVVAFYIDNSTKHQGLKSSRYSSLYYRPKYFFSCKLSKYIEDILSGHQSSLFKLLKVEVITKIRVIFVLKFFGN